MLSCKGQNASQVICGLKFEGQATLKLERTQKATLQMRKLKLIGFPKATKLFITNASSSPASLSRGREPQCSLLQNICQQLATNLLTGDLPPFVRNGTEVMHPIRKGQKARLSGRENGLPLWLAMQGRAEIGWWGGSNWNDSLWSNPSLTSKISPLRLH